MFSLIICLLSWTFYVKSQNCMFIFFFILNQGRIINITAVNVPDWMWKCDFIKIHRIIMSRNLPYSMSYFVALQNFRYHFSLVFCNGLADIGEIMKRNYTIYQGRIFSYISVIYIPGFIYRIFFVIYWKQLQRQWWFNLPV